MYSISDIVRSTPAVPWRTGPTPPLSASFAAPLASVALLLAAALVPPVVGIGRSKAYQLAQDDQFPCRVIGATTHIKVSTDVQTPEEDETEQ